MGWTEGRLDTDDSQFVQLGQIIDGYRLERELGRSAHGVSFFARRESTAVLTWNAAMVPESGVVKLLWPPMGLRNERARARFRDRFDSQTQALRAAIGVLIPSAAEARAAQIITWGGAPDHPYMIRSYVDGYSLAKRLMDHPQGLALPDVARYVSRAASALDYAHARGITHGALALENMLVSHEGDLLVSDFGIERLLFPLGSDSAAPPSSSIARYSTPERFSGGRAGPAADTYSLGVALYALVCGQFPFDGETVEEIRRARASAAAPSPRTHRPDLPPQVETVLMKALSKTSRGGFATAGALASAFGAAVEDATGEKIVIGRSAQDALSGSQSRSAPARRAAGVPSESHLEPRPGAPETNGDGGVSATRMPRPFLPPGTVATGPHGASPSATLPNSSELRELEELETARLSEDGTAPPSAAAPQRAQPMRPLNTHPPAGQSTMTEVETAPLKEMSRGGALRADTAKSSAPGYNAARTGMAAPPAALGAIEPAAPALRLGEGPHFRRGWRLQTRGGMIVGASLIIVVGATVALTHAAYGGPPAPGAPATPVTTMAVGATVTDIASVTSAPTTTSHPVKLTPRPTVAPTVAPSATPSPTGTPTGTPTATPTDTPTVTPTDTPTATPATTP